MDEYQKLVDEIEPHALGANFPPPTSQMFLPGRPLSSETNAAISPQMKVTFASGSRGVREKTKPQRVVLRVER